MLYDRIFLKDIDSHSRTPSNSLFYSYLAGGFFSVFLLLIFYSFLTFRLIVFLLNNLKRKKKFDKYILISLITIFIILLRSIIENSFSIWGLDLIFLTLSINLINSKSKIKI